MFWAPRVLTIAWIAFVSLFALDVLGEGHGLWRTLGALVLHLIPAFVLTGMLAIAWRRDGAGASLFAAAGVFFLVIVRPTWQNKLLIAGPAFAAAGLYLANWLTPAAEPTETP